MSSFNSKDQAVFSGCVLGLVSTLPFALIAIAFGFEQMKQWFRYNNWVVLWFLWSVVYAKFVHYKFFFTASIYTHRMLLELCCMMLVASGVYAVAGFLQ